MKLSASERSQMAALLGDGADKVLRQLVKVCPGEWMLDPLQWEVRLQGLWKTWPRSDPESKMFYGAFFSMPGAAVLTVFPRSTASALLRSYAGSPASDIPPVLEPGALGEVANILVNAIGGVLADACRFSFFLPSPEVFFATKPDLLEKLRQAMFQLQGPGQEPALLTRITLRTRDFDCLLAVLLSVAWRDSVQAAGAV